MKTTKLNLGCGMNYRKDYINIDMDLKYKPDLIVDITEGLPFENDSVDEILAYNIFEHILPCAIRANKIIDPFDFVIDEIYRISKPDGIIKIIVPYAPASAGYFFPKHLRPFNLNSFFEYDITNCNKKAVFPKEFFEGKFKWATAQNAGVFSKNYFNIKKRKLTFPRGFNPLNHIAFIFNVFTKLQDIYEGTILKHFFPADYIYFELKVIK